MDALAWIDRFYPEENELKKILLLHSRQVCAKALAVARRHPSLHLDETVLENGSLLHDIGIFQTWAPGIHCFGTYHYLLHGYLGAQMLREEGEETYARICERHTGTGLSQQTIQEMQLPIPQQDYLPETMEEQVICYADKFYSKSHLQEEKTLDQVRHSLQKFGENQVARFMQWHALFR